MGRTKNNPLNKKNQAITPNGLSEEITKTLRTLLASIDIHATYDQDGNRTIGMTADRGPSATLRDLGFGDVTNALHTHPKFHDLSEEEEDVIYLQLLLKDLNQARNKVGQWMQAKELRRQSR